MPFQSELATGSALHETDVRLDGIAQSISGLISHVNEIDSTRPTRTEIHGISGNYATHGEVREWAAYASGGAVTYATSAIAEASGSLAHEIDQLETNYVEADTIVLSGAEKYAHDLVSDTSGALERDYRYRFTTETRKWRNAITTESNRALKAERNIETKFGDWCTTISGNLDTSAKLLSDEDIRINGRIDTYQQTFSAVLDDVSAVAKEALEENDFNTFINSAGVQYSEDTKTMYLGRGVGEKVSLSANGDIASRMVVAEKVDAGSITCGGTVSAGAFRIGSGASRIEYEGGDAVSFRNADTGVAMLVSVGTENIRYELPPAISYVNEDIRIGKPSGIPVSMILIGDAARGVSHKNCVVISPPNRPTGDRWLPKGSGTITMYTTANPVESGIYIGASTLPEIITKYAASKDELEHEVLTEIQNVSGGIGTEIHNDLWQETNQLVSGAISTSEQNLSAYVNTETQRRIDDVQSVRDELPNYLPVMGGTVLGDLTASAFNVFDAFSAIDEGPNKLFPYNDNYFISGIEIKATLLTPMTVLEKRIASGIPADSTDVRLDITGVVYHEDPETHVRTISGDYHRSDTLECQYASSVSQYIYDGELGRVHVPLDLTQSITIWEYLLSAGSYTFSINGDCNFCGPVSIVQYVDERTEAIATAASTLQEVAEYLKSINEGD